jgi:hypothetical protein
MPVSVDDRLAAVAKVLLNQSAQFFDSQRVGIGLVEPTDTFVKICAGS